MIDSPKAGDSQVNLKKIIVPFEQEGPAEEPLFVNMFQVAFHEEIVYIDAGVIPLDDVLNRDKKPELSFLLLSRLVMSVPTLKNLQTQIGSLLERLGSRDATTPP
jgi:hypothetical protein